MESFSGILKYESVLDVDVQLRRGSSLDWVIFTTRN